MKHLTHKSTAIILIAVVALIIGAGAIFSSKSGAGTGEKVNAPKPALTVTTVQPVEASFPIRLTANGSIAAWQEAIIGSETNGLKLLEVRVNVGDRVRAGDVLATFALDSVQAEVAQTRASVAEAEASAADAAANADKARTLQASGALSEQQINQYTTAEKTAKARLEAAKASQAVQQVRLRQTRLLAPDNGIISARTATVGAVVGTGTELFRMIRGGRLEWRAEVTSSELSRLVVGTPATVVASNGAEVRGRVRMIGPTVDVQTRAALVYVDLPTSSTSKGTGRSEGPPQARPTPPGGSAVREATSVGALLLPGMFAKGEFDLGNSPALTIPQQSVVIRDGFSYVFLLNANSHVSQLKVQTGRRLGDRVEVTSGLQPDAELVASGAGFLNDGDLVSKVAAPSTANAAANPKIPPNMPGAPEKRAQSAIK